MGVLEMRKVIVRAGARVSVDRKPKSAKDRSGQTKYCQLDSLVLTFELALSSVAAF